MDEQVPYSISKDFGFAAAHCIPDHPGKCRNLHGHNYRVRVHLRASQLDELGMVIDFTKLKVWMKEVMGRFDHRVLNELPPFDRINPTAEQLSEVVFEGIRERVDDPRVAVHRVEVWENDSSCAVFEP